MSEVDEVYTDQSRAMIFEFSKKGLNYLSQNMVDNCTQKSSFYLTSIWIIETFMQLKDHLGYTMFNL